MLFHNLIAGSAVVFENQVITVNNEVLQVLSIPEKERGWEQERDREREWRGDTLNKEKIQLQPMPKGLAWQTCAETLKHHNARLMRSKGSGGQRHFRNTISLKDEKCHSIQRYIFNLVSSCVRWPLTWLDILQLGSFVIFFFSMRRMGQFLKHINHETTILNPCRLDTELYREGDFKGHFLCIPIYFLMCSYQPVLAMSPWGDPNTVLRAVPILY